MAALRTVTGGVLLTLALSLPSRLAAQAPPPAAEPADEDAEAAREPAQPQEPRSKARRNEVVVTASRLPSNASDVPADVTVIGRDQVDPHDSSVIQSLSHVAGVRVDDRPSDSLFGGFELRGFGTNDTSGSNALILLDGIPQRRLSFGGPYLGMLPFDAVQRQELVRGSMGSLYGRGAIAGALQLFTDPGGEEWHVRSSVLAKSTNDTLRGSVRVSGPLGLGDGATFSLTASGRDTQGWQDETHSDKRDVYFHGVIPLGGQDSLTVLLGVATGKDEVASPVLIDAQGRRLPGIDRDTNLSVPDHNFFDLDEYRAAVKWRHDFSDRVHGEVDISYWKGDTVMFLGRPSNGPAPGSATVDRLTSERYWEEEAYFTQALVEFDSNFASWLTGSFVTGVSYEYLSWDNDTRNVRVSTSTFATGVPIDYTNPVEPDPSTYIFQPFTTRFTDENHVGGFVRSQWDVGEDWVVHLGCRYDTYDRNQDNRNSGNSSRVEKDAISPAAGVLWHMVATDELMLSPYANWGRGFNPVFRAVGTTEIADVDPERSESYEVGLKGDGLSGMLEGNVAVYQIDRDDVVAFDAATSSYRNSGR